jgi:hypothetical protein
MVRSLAVRSLSSSRHHGSGCCRLISLFSIATLQHSPSLFFANSYLIFRRSPSLPRMITSFLNLK